MFLDLMVLKRINRVKRIRAYFDFVNDQINNGNITFKLLDNRFLTLVSGWQINYRPESNI